MTEIQSILEIVDSENKILLDRNRILGEVKGVGPVDTCFVVREHLPSGLKKFVSKAYTRTYIHYIYGVDTSSLSSIAAYFRHYLDISINKTRNSRVLSGYFCTYDLFSKLDMRVEIKIPGNTIAYLTDSSGHQYKADSIHWEGCYLSSGLRNFYPTRGTAVNLTQFFKTLEDIQRFFSLSLKFWSKLGFVLGDIRDTSKYSINLLIPAISKYLTRRKRYKLHQALFKSYIEKDPLMLTFLANSSFKIGKLEEICVLLKNQIKMTPHAFPLYYSAAKAYLKKGEVVQSIKLCQYLVELNLEVYEYWDLLIQGLIKNKEYSSALLCFNFIPHYTLNTDSNFLGVSENQLILPEKLSFSAAGNIWITPSDLDFRAFQDTVIEKSLKEQQLLQKINNLPALSLNGSKERAYRLLVKVEKYIEWENMLKIKQSIMNKVQSPQIEEEQKIVTQNFSSLGAGEYKSGFTRTGFQTFSQDFTPDNDPYIDDYQPAQLLTQRNYFLQDHSISKLSMLMNPAHRIQTKDTTQLYKCLFNDLKSIYEWQKESSDIQAVHALKNSKN